MAGRRAGTGGRIPDRKIVSRRRCRRDSRPDLLAGSATLGFTRLLTRNNTGRKPRGWVPLPVPARAFVTAVALADFDRNGRADPVIACSVAEGTSWLNSVQVQLSFVDRFQTVKLPLTVSNPLSGQ